MSVLNRSNESTLGYEFTDVVSLQDGPTSSSVQ